MTFPGLYVYLISQDLTPGLFRYRRFNLICYQIAYNIPIDNIVYFVFPSALSRQRKKRPKCSFELFLKGNVFAANHNFRYIETLPE